MKDAIKTVVSLIVLLMVFMGVIVFASEEKTEIRFVGQVTRIVDGDTLHMRGREASIRLWGVDAPEKDENGFSEAKNALNLIASNQVLDCEQIDVDRYRRTVVRCWRPDGQEINRMMIEGGTATEYMRYSRGAYSR